MEKLCSGWVFDIQHYSIHDGPGIRTTVFLKGCPLRCMWCQNPESQNLKPELYFIADKCRGCGVCVDLCPEQAISVDSGIARTDRIRCTACGACVPGCPFEARKIAGTSMTVDDVIREIEGDTPFYAESGGGITVSGGEALSQPAFAAEILKGCREKGIHTVVETSGFGAWITLRSVLENADLVLFDFKHMNEGRHVEGTGVSNRTILENAVKIRNDLGISLTARMPVIPGYNDSEENVSAMAEFIASRLKPPVEVHLLPYHAMGEGKREHIGRTGGGFKSETPSAGRMHELKELVESYGLSARIGG